MQSPFRSKTPQTPGSAVMCSRHPRSWVEKKVFFLTKTRICPYCELESFAPVDPNNPDSLPPLEPGFGGFAPPEPPSKPAPTPRGRGHRRRPSGSSQAGTPRYTSTPRSTVVRRTAVFKPTQSPRGDQLSGKPPRAAGAPSPRTRPPGAPSPSGKGTSRRKKAPSSSHRRCGSGGSSSGGSGDLLKRGVDAAAGTEARGDPGDSLSTPRAGGGTLPPRPHPVPVVDASPSRPKKSLMFTSAARRRGGSVRTPKRLDSAATEKAGLASLSPRSMHAVPPSPSGSAFSGFSSVGSASGFGLETPRRKSGSGELLGTGLDAPRIGLGGLTLSVTSPAHGRRTEGAPIGPSSPTGSSLFTAGEESAGVERGVAPASNSVSPSLEDNAKESSVGVATRSAARAASEAVLCLAEATDPDIRDQVKPAATATVSLATALEALRPESVEGGVGGGPESVVLWASGVASSAATDAAMLWREEEEGGSVGPTQDVEAAGAILAEAGGAVEKLAQTARAFVWSGNASLVARSATFAERHRQASSAVLEAAARAEALLAVRLAAGKPPREAVSAQRRWLAVLDHHEAWTTRSASKTGLLEAQQEISAGVVAIFKDCKVLGEGVFGPSFAAEYLGMPASVSVLEETSPNASAESASREADAAARVRATATEELRTLAAILPPHPRLARTHGIEMISASVPLNILHATVDGDGESGQGDSPAGGESAANPATKPALVMVSELVEGGTLRKRVAVVEKQGTPGGAKAAVFGMMVGLLGQQLQPRQILADIAAGLACLHSKGVAHGALSSENVLLDAAGRAKLSLFGLTNTRRAVAAYTAGDSAASLARPTCWTPPEVLRSTQPSAAAETGSETAGAEVGSKAAGEAADAYAFAMVAVELLTGKQPWEGVSVEEMSERILGEDRPEIPAGAVSSGALDGFDGFAALLAKLWAQDPAERPAMEDVAHALCVPTVVPKRDEPTVPSTVEHGEEAMASDGDGTRATNDETPLSVGDTADAPRSNDGAGSPGHDGTFNREESLHDRTHLAVEPASVVPVQDPKVADTSDIDGVPRPDDKGDDTFASKRVDASGSTYGSAPCKAHDKLNVGDLSLNEVEEDEAGCPVADGPAGGCATPSGGGGGDTLVAGLDEDNGADVPYFENATSDEPGGNAKAADGDFFRAKASGGEAERLPDRAEAATVSLVDVAIEDMDSDGPFHFLNSPKNAHTESSYDESSPFRSDSSRTNVTALAGEAFVVNALETEESKDVAPPEQASAPAGRTAVESCSRSNARGLEGSLSQVRSKVDASLSAAPRAGASGSDVNAPHVTLESDSAAAIGKKPPGPEEQDGERSDSDADELYFSADEEDEQIFLSRDPAAPVTIPVITTRPVAINSSWSMADTDDDYGHSERVLSSSFEIPVDAFHSTAPSEGSRDVTTTDSTAAPTTGTSRTAGNSQSAASSERQAPALTTPTGKRVRVLRQPKKKTSSAFAAIRASQREIEEQLNAPNASTSRTGGQVLGDVVTSPLALRESTGSTDNASSDSSATGCSAPPGNAPAYDGAPSSVPVAPSAEVSGATNANLGAMAIMTPPPQHTSGMVTPPPLQPAERRAAAEQGHAKGAFSAIANTPRRARMALRGVASSLGRFRKSNKRGDGMVDYGDA